jgi:AcrR family transcriptional regulator
MTDMPRASAPRTGTGTGTGTGTSLRERKKIRTRQAIRRAAYRLFAEQGYEATRVDQIADAAEVSPSTVFRYFPTKEDIVLTDEEDPVLAATLRARPAHEPPLTALREAILGAIRQVYETPEALAEARQRMRLVASVPAIRGRLHESMAASGGVVTAALAERTGRATDDLELRVFVSAVLAGLGEVLLYWAEHEPDNDDIAPLIDRAFDVLDDRLAGPAS